MEHEQESFFPEPSRRCPGCFQERPEHEFRNSPHCRYCYRFANALRLSVPYDRLLDEQGGGCGICGATPENGSRLHIDHIHRRPEDRDGFAYVRGLLCPRCNVVLGQGEDSPQLFRRMAEYLERPAQRFYLVVVRGRRRHRSHGPAHTWKRTKM